MRFEIIAVRDRAINSFGSPFFVPAVGHALRSFSNEINREDSEFGKNPEDYDLYLIGSYDSDSGDLVAQKPEMIAIGKDMVKTNRSE